jgi:hypothetical protein
MATFHELTTAQLRHALQLREHIESLQKELASLLGGNSAPAAKPEVAASTPGRKKKAKRTMSPEAREKIAAAARARWARVRGKSPAKSAKSAPVKTVAKAPKTRGGKKTRQLTPEGRARLAAAMKARWAARKAANS